jgi:hypothetical protein
VLLRQRAPLGLKNGGGSAPTNRGGSSPIDNKKPGTYKTGPRFACFVREEKEFHERLEYMRLNPAKKGPVKRG